MTDTTQTARVDWNSSEQNVRLRKRYHKEKIFKFCTIFSLGTAIAALMVVMISIFSTGISGFKETRITIDIMLDPTIIGEVATLDDNALQTHLASVNINKILLDTLRKKFPDVKRRADVFALLRLFSVGAQSDIRSTLLNDISQVGKTIPIALIASSDVDMLMKGNISRDVPESDRKITDKQIKWVDHFIAEGRVTQGFNWTFLTTGDSREPELAGIKSAAVGSLLTLLVTFLISFPIGVGTAIYLEEFAKRTRFTDLIEININNLAAVPSIIFGLLGLAKKDL